MSSSDQTCAPSAASLIINKVFMLIYLLIAVFALYLAFKCNDGFEIWSFLAALFCPYIYIPYVLATKGTCGEFGFSMGHESQPAAPTVGPTTNQLY